MELKVKSFAGTLESSDVYIIVEPHKNSIEVDLKSSVYDQFSCHIKKVVYEVLEEMEIKEAKITIDDRGALDSVIRARLQTAIMRSIKSTEYKWN